MDEEDDGLILIFDEHLQIPNRFDVAFDVRNGLIFIRRSQGKGKFLNANQNNGILKLGLTDAGILFTSLSTYIVLGK